MNRILIGALSCQSYEQRRLRCLKTWVPEALELGIDVLFLIGGETHKAYREGQNLYLPCPDDYPSLPQKVRLFYQWALENCEFDYIFKCDDDTYLRADRLAAFDTQHQDYIGAEWTPGVGYASGGAGYWLSRRAAAIAVAGLEATPQGAEDVLVGQCLRQAGIPFYCDSRFVAFGNEVLRPTPENMIVTTHGCDPPWKTHRVEFAGQAPVVSCNPKGRLGNNLFQVAAALGYAAKHGIHKPQFAPESFGKYSNTVFRNLSYAPMPEEHMVVGDLPDFSYNAKIPVWPSCSVMFQGYFQSEKYFEHCPDLIRQMFTLSEETEALLQAKFGEILQSQPVSLHVRRGDYLQRQEYHPVQTAEYYLGALQMLSEHENVSHVLCFSDDPDWCDEHLAAFDQRILVVRGQDDVLDLALMTLCWHHIIANSSFSWWGAWLGRNPDKIVIVPDVYLGPAFAGYTERDLIPSRWIRLASLKDGRGIHNHGFWLTAHEQEHHAHDSELCRALVEVFREEGGRVVDFGCGPGDYVKAMKAAGIACAGYDGNPKTPQFTQGTCQVLDLSIPVQLPEQYEWVLSLEVGEHIPAAYETTFIQNLDHHNTRGVILSWAVEGQGGHGHVNEHSNRYIEERFRQLGYHRDLITERRLRQRVTNCSWFRNTLMVFRRHCRNVGPSLSTGDIRLLVERDDPLILELGAHDGADSTRFLNEFSSIRLHCFEPDPRPLARFRAQDHRCILHQVAIASEDGVVDLHLSGGLPPDQRMLDWDLSSSIRPPTGHLAAHPWCTFDRACQVQGRSLDSWIIEHTEIKTIDLIWADLQGAEIDLIRGGRATLRYRTRFLYTEFYETPMYEGQISRREILELLPEFECLGTFEGYNMLLRNRLLVEG